MYKELSIDQAMPWLNFNQASESFISNVGYTKEQALAYVKNIDKRLLTRLGALGKDNNKVIIISSAMRPYSHQEYKAYSNGWAYNCPAGLSAKYNKDTFNYLDYLAGWYKQDPAKAKYLATPGNSRHNSGMAVDVNDNWVQTKIDNTDLAPYGIYKPMSYENWHIEPIESRTELTGKTVSVAIKLGIPQPIYNVGEKSGCIQRGASVAVMQDALVKAGYVLGAVDGIWGAGTAKALADFQKANNISPDGICGAKTKVLLKLI